MDKEKLIFLAVSAAMLLGAVRLLPKRALPLEPVSFAVATDLHYIAPELTDNGAAFQLLAENSDGKDMLHCEEITDAFLRDIASAKPAALILSGDLTYNGERASHEELAKKLRRLQNTGVPVLVLPGNHDIDNPSAAIFHGDTYELTDSIGADEFAELYGPFGYENALSRDESSLSYTAALTPKLWALMLDVNATAEPGVVQSETLSWARGQLESARRQGIRVLAVSHQNLLRHNSLFFDGFMMQGWEELLTLYEQYQVICNLSGHMHVQHIADRGTQLSEIATSALITWPNQYGILTLDGTSGHYYTVPVALEERTASEAYWLLWNTAYRQAGAELTSGATVASGIDGLCSFFAGVNTRYVAGLGDTIHWDDAAVREWQERGAVLAAYLGSIRDDGFHNWTEYRFTFR